MTSHSMALFVALLTHGMHEHERHADRLKEKILAPIAGMRNPDCDPKVWVNEQAQGLKGLPRA